VANPRGLLDTLKQLRHRKPNPKFCPACKGHNIYPQSILGILPTTYVCRDCGYTGVVAFEIDPEQKEPADPEPEK